MNRVNNERTSLTVAHALLKLHCDLLSYGSEPLFAKAIGSFSWRNVKGSRSSGKCINGRSDKNHLYPAFSHYIAGTQPREDYSNLLDGDVLAKWGVFGENKPLTFRNVPRPLSISNETGYDLPAYTPNRIHVSTTDPLYRTAYPIFFFLRDSAPQSILINLFSPDHLYLISGHHIHVWDEDIHG